MTRTLPAMLVAVLAALALMLSGCSGDSSGQAGDKSSKSAAQAKADRADRKASKAIADSIMKSQRSGSTSQFLDLSRQDADCIGNGFVDKIGRKRLQHYGLLTRKLDARRSMTGVKMAAADAKKATAVLFRCTDVGAMVRKAIGKAGAIPKQMRSCVTKALDEENLRGVFTEIFQGKQAQAQQQLTTPLSRCALGSSGNG